MPAEFTRKEVEALALEKIKKGTKRKVLVAFVDLLGFKSNLLDEWEEKSDDFILRTMKIKAIIQLAKERAVNHTFYKYDKETVIGSSKYPEHITISDAFVFFKELDETSQQTKIISVLSIVGSIYELWRASIINGFTIRGAIEFGEVFYSDEEVIGPSYMEAYRGETFEAKTSRIICFQNVADIINENIEHVEPELLDYCRLWFKKDSDNWLILNPLTAFGIDNPKMVNQALELVKKMEIETDSEKIKIKYADLIKDLSNRRAEYSDMNIFKRKE